MLKRVVLALAAATLFNGTAAAESGREIYERQCRGCHTDSLLGGSLHGIVGTRAGTRSSGVHSRVIVESGIVWNSDSLRRFLSDPRREVPGTIMPVGVSDAEKLERLLDYLESLTDRPNFDQTATQR